MELDELAIVVEAHPAEPLTAAVVELGDAVTGTEGGTASNKENKRQVYA
jgi:hypothetical protein